MAINSRTAMPLALLMLAVALAFCAFAQATTNPDVTGGGATTITITGSTNTIAGSCTATISTTGQFSDLSIAPNVRTCTFKNVIDGTTWVSIKITQLACSTVSGQWLQTKEGARVCLMKL